MEFSKKISDGQIPQGRYLLDGAIDDLLEFLRCLENEFHIVEGQAPNAGEVAYAE